MDETGKDWAGLEWDCTGPGQTVLDWTDGAGLDWVGLRRTRPDWTGRASSWTPFIHLILFIPPSSPTPSSFSPPLHPPHAHLPPSPHPPLFFSSISSFFASFCSSTSPFPSPSTYSLHPHSHTSHTLHVPLAPRTFTRGRLIVEVGVYPLEGDVLSRLVGARGDDNLKLAGFWMKGAPGGVLTLTLPPSIVRRPRAPTLPLLVGAISRNQAYLGSGRQGWLK